MLVQIYLLEAVSSVWIDISNPYADPSWFCRIYAIEIKYRRKTLRILQTSNISEWISSKVGQTVNSQETSEQWCAMCCLSAWDKTQYIGI